MALGRIYLHVFLAFHGVMIPTKLNSSISNRCRQIKSTALVCTIKVMCYLGFILLVVSRVCWVFDFCDMCMFGNVC